LPASLSYDLSRRHLCFGLTDMSPQLTEGEGVCALRCGGLLACLASSDAMYDGYISRALSGRFYQDTEENVRLTARQRADGSCSLDDRTPKGSDDRARVAERRGRGHRRYHGMGFATAKRFVAEGAFVFMTGHRQREYDRAVRAISSNVIGIQGASPDCRTSRSPLRDRERERED
jgi:hypothetical protein